MLTWSLVRNTAVSDLRTSVNKCVLWKRKQGRHSAIVKNFFKCTRYSSSVLGTFSLMEEQSLRSPACLILPQLDCLSIPQALIYWALLDGRPFGPGPRPGHWWQPSGPWLSVQTWPPWIIPWRWTTGLCWRHTDVTAMFYIEFLFVLVGKKYHCVLVGKYLLIFYSAPELAPVDGGLENLRRSQRKVKSTCVWAAWSSSACLARSGSVVPWTQWKPNCIK